MAKTTALGWGSAGTNALEGTPSPGNRGSESSESKKKSLSEKPPVSPSPAQRTAPPLKKATVSSSARSAGGSSKDKGSK